MRVGKLMLAMFAVVLLASVVSAGPVQVTVTADHNPLLVGEDWFLSRSTPVLSFPGTAGWFAYPDSYRGLDLRFTLFDGNLQFVVNLADAPYTRADANPVLLVMDVAPNALYTSWVPIGELPSPDSRRIRAIRCRRPKQFPNPERPA